MAQHMVVVDGQRVPLADVFRKHAVLKEALEGMPLDEVLEMLADPQPPHLDGLVRKTGFDLSPRLDGTHADWARRVLDAAVARSELLQSEALLRWAFVALARAGGTCEARWECVFPTTTGAATSALVTEAASTLRPERALAVAKAAMERDRVGAPHTALAILRAHDDEALARHLLEYRSAAFGPERVEAMVRTLADRPNVSRALGGSGDALVLRVVSRRVPRAAGELDEARRAQLEVAGERYDGSVMSAATRLADGSTEGALGAAWEHRELADASGGLRIDAWLFGGDGGTCFEAGTTRVVATLVQGGVRLAQDRPAALEEALARATAGLVGRDEVD